MILKQVKRYRDTVIKEQEITPEYRIPVTLSNYAFKFTVRTEAYRRYWLRKRMEMGRAYGRFSKVGGAL